MNGDLAASYPIYARHTSRIIRAGRKSPKKGFCPNSEGKDVSPRLIDFAFFRRN